MVGWLLRGVWDDERAHQSTCVVPHQPVTHTHTHTHTSAVCTKLAAWSRSMSFTLQWTSTHARHTPRHAAAQASSSWLKPSESEALIDNAAQRHTKPTRSPVSEPVVERELPAHVAAARVDGIQPGPAPGGIVYRVVALFCVGWCAKWAARVVRLCQREKGSTGGDAVAFCVGCSADPHS
jgi:hypothetical protein